jgi:hypothetical protein
MKTIPNQQEKSKSGNASLFKEIFSPYVGKHIAKKQDLLLFGEEGRSGWLTIDQPLTDPRIDTAIQGVNVIGYFLSLCTRCFSIDIDDHAGKGPGYLLSVYQTVVGKLHCYPSLVCKTPHGLHTFYFLAHYVPEILLIAKARDALRGVPVEVKPTQKIGLRIPAEPDMIDPRTWRS